MRTKTSHHYSKLQIQKKLDDCYEAINKTSQIPDSKTALTLLKNSLNGLLKSIKSDLDRWEYVEN